MESDKQIIHCVELLTPYTEKSFVLVGDTIHLKDHLRNKERKIFGTYNRFLHHPDGEKVKGWIFKLESIERVIQYIRERKDTQLVIKEFSSPIRHTESNEH